MDWIKAGLLAGVMVVTPLAAQAVTPVTSVQDAAASRMALSRRYVELMQSDQVGDAIRGLIAADAQNDPEALALPAEERRFISELTAELTTEAMPLMLDQLVPVYAEVFTEEELRALIAFYETPMGREITRKTTASMPEANAAIMAVMPQLVDKMVTRMCVYYECSPEELRQAREDAAQAYSATTPARTK